MIRLHTHSQCEELHLSFIDCLRLSWETARMSIQSSIDQQRFDAVENLFSEKCDCTKLMKQHVEIRSFCCTRIHKLSYLRLCIIGTKPAAT